MLQTGWSFSVQKATLPENRLMAIDTPGNRQRRLNYITFF
jgi:hypothetical protein